MANGTERRTVATATRAVQVPNPGTAAAQPVRRVRLSSPGLAVMVRESFARDVEAEAPAYAQRDLELTSLRARLTALEAWQEAEYRRITGAGVTHDEHRAACTLLWAAIHRIHRTAKGARS